MYAIVAVGCHWGIGKDGRLLFSLLGDLKRFRALTSGGTVVMGRKTLESFPCGRPLPKRRNLVLSSQRIEVPGTEWFQTLDTLCAAAAQDDPAHVFVIGGGSVYAALLSNCTHAFLTKVDAAAEAPDTWFPNLDALPEWEMDHISDPVTENGVTYQFLDYVNLSRL